MFGVCVHKKALDGQKTLNNYETMIRKGAEDHRRSQDFSKGGHTVSKSGYSPDCHVDLHAVFLIKKKF